MKVALYEYEATRSGRCVLARPIGTRVADIAVDSVVEVTSRHTGSTGSYRVKRRRETKLKNLAGDDFSASDPELSAVQMRHRIEELYRFRPFWAGGETPIAVIELELLSA